MGGEGNSLPSNCCGCLLIYSITSSRRVEITIIARIMASTEVLEGNRWGFTLEDESAEGREELEVCGFLPKVVDSFSFPRY